MGFHLIYKNIDESVSFTGGSLKIKFTRFHLEYSDYEKIYVQKNISVKKSKYIYINSVNLNVLQTT